MKTKIVALTCRYLVATLQEHANPTPGQKAKGRENKMADVSSAVTNVSTCVRVIAETEPWTGSSRGLIEHLPGKETETRVRFSEFDDIAASQLTIGLIDSYRFSRECLSSALADQRPKATILPFDTAENCVAGGCANLDLIIFYLHCTGTSDAAAMRKVTAVAELLPNIPLVVLSDAEDAEQIKIVYNTLKCGASGIIATRTTGILIATAAIRLVRAGGTFAPTDMLLSDHSGRDPGLPDTMRQNRLTSRQMSVLSHVQRGHANKTIAHELSMSESTVKVHVRNIMRKLGATNRTQAAYKAQRMFEGGAIAEILNA